MNLSYLKAEKLIAQHKRKIEELGKLIQYGDWRIVSDRLEISKGNAQNAFRRITSKRHHDVANMLEKVIEERLSKFETNKEEL